MGKRKSVICPSCSRPLAGGVVTCPYCGEPLGPAFRMRFWMALAVYLAVAFAVAALASFPAGFGELSAAWLEAMGLVSDPCAESALPALLRALALLILFLPVSRRAPGVPAPLGVGEIASGLAWRLLLFADGALCAAAAQCAPTLSTLIFCLPLAAIVYAGIVRESRAGVAHQ